MFFENDLISFNILDVLTLSQKNISIYNSGRNYNALSFRLRSDAVIKTRDNCFRMHDNSISFVPARLDYKRVAAFDDIIVIHFELANCAIGDVEVFTPENAQPFKNLFTKALQLWNEKAVAYKYRCSAILNEILALCHEEKYTPAPSKSKIQPSVDYMLANYTRPDITVEQIASRSFMSEVYFRKLFKAEYGASPQKYIISLRINYAKQLISTRYYSLKEVALLSGYNDYKYFATEFKRATGISPSQYHYNYPV